MNTETNYASLFYSESQHDIGFLEKTVADFPVSSVARFLLLYHYKKNKLSGFDALAKQTGIYLNNHLWIQFQLSEIEKPPENKIAGIANEFAEEGNKISKISEPENELDEEKLLTSDQENKLPFEEKKDELIREFENESGEKESLPSEILTEIPKRLETENKEEINEAISSEEQLPTTVNGQVTQIPASEIVSDDEENEEGLLVSEIQSEEIIESKETEKESSSEDQKNIIAENPDPSNEEIQIEDKSVVDIKIPKEEVQKEEVLNHDFDSENEEEIISFEPLHTVDYFASQGIKINEEALANDHLVKQVKSFTAWLKSMKKLHPGQLPEQNEVIEKIIQSASEASNQDANVLTEAMAEVLTKQGKRQKAIEMYEKLSLINPSKNAYFAAKIESLKIT
jgi:hypothetical protein